MSGLAKNYEKVIRKELAAHGAWFPVTNTLKVGDYGFFDGGVFRSVGNVTDKYPDVALKVVEGPATKIDFSSEGTRTSRLDAGGNALESFAAVGNVEAKLKFEFTKENSVVIKIANIVVNQLQNIEEIALLLASKKDWKKKYKVISATYVGKDSLVICSREAGSDFQISASANLLKSVEAGKASGAFETSSTKSSAFHSVGEEGVMALRLFKLNWRGNLKVLSDDQLADAITTEESPTDEFDWSTEDDF
jgi:hypothetical protein